MKQIKLVFGNLWLIIALLLFVGKTAVRSDPVRYAFFGVGGLLSPAAYWIIIAACAVLGLFMLLSSLDDNSK